MNDLSSGSHLFRYFLNVCISNLQRNFKNSDNNFHIRFTYFASCLHFHYLLYPFLFLPSSIPLSVYLSIIYLPTYLPVSINHLSSPSFYLYLRIYILFILSMAPCYSWKLQCVTPKNKNITSHNHNTISKSRNLTNYTVLLTSPCSFSNFISSKNVLFF